MRNRILSTLQVSFGSAQFWVRRPFFHESVKLSGTVVDASGSVMVNVVSGDNGNACSVVASGKTNAEGAFEMNVAPGQYVLKIGPSFRMSASRYV
jgi:hypothetical protein